MTEDMTLEVLVSDFCARILPDFSQLKPKLRELHPEWEPRELAMNLMEFGRGLISNVAKPSADHVAFIQRFTDALVFDDAQVGLFTAYAGGCLMGLTIKGQLQPDTLVEALELAAQFAQTRLGSVA